MTFEEFRLLDQFGGAAAYDTSRGISSRPSSDWSPSRVYPLAPPPIGAQALSYFGESFMFQLEGLDKYKKQANDIRLPLHLNLAACKLKTKEWDDVVGLCSEVKGPL
eukprot:1179828-Prorocentrum_minimum.AAC.7